MRSGKSGRFEEATCCCFCMCTIFLPLLLPCVCCPLFETRTSGEGLELAQKQMEIGQKDNLLHPLRGLARLASNSGVFLQLGAFLQFLSVKFVVKWMLNWSQSGSPPPLATLATHWLQFKREAKGKKNVRHQHAGQP